VETERMVVLSDLHLGNPYCQTARKVLDFLKDAVRAGWDICVNGDGLEIAQVSFAKLAKDVPQLFKALGRMSNDASNIYYVVGNHDMALEHFLNDWGKVVVSPFLNVRCGGQRIRVEHGHVYDPMFVFSPTLYEAMTAAGGLILNAAPRAYELWMAWEKLAWGNHTADAEGIEGEAPHFSRAAREIARRGFDAVVFGHTHHVGQVPLDRGSTYLNPGSWLAGESFVAITPDGAELREWSPGSLL
jgi:UDP-2,3-diacylglucosamine pyrophosphatase LpxH